MSQSITDCSQRHPVQMRSQAPSHALTSAVGTLTASDRHAWPLAWLIQGREAPTACVCAGACESPSYRWPDPRIVRCSLQRSCFSPTRCQRSAIIMGSHSTSVRAAPWLCRYCCVHRGQHAAACTASAPHPKRLPSRGVCYAPQRSSSKTRSVTWLCTWTPTTPTRTSCYLKANSATKPSTSSRCTRYDPLHVAARHATCTPWLGMTDAATIT